MTTDHSITFFLDLPGGRRVEVGMTVTEEPLIPTPGEPDVEREPHLHEWAEICAKLARLDTTFIKTKS